MNFRTWPGGKIDGISYGLDGGSFNYWNNYLQAGTKTQRFEGGLFLSDVRGESALAKAVSEARIGRACAL